MNSERTPRSGHGFSLVEVMVALVVIAIGLLGIAKMQALALAATGSASMRSLAAIEAASLAASMHANRDYWASGLEPQLITVTNGVISDPTLAAASNCNSGAGAPCTPSTLAAYDMQQWVAALAQLLPNAAATITCPNLTPPLTCTVQLSWTEKTVAVNSQEAATESADQAAVAGGATAAGFENPTYTLYVEP